MRNTLLTAARKAGNWVRLGTKTRLLGLVLIAGILAVGCSQGSYPLDIFYEMHYQQSFKAQEPPRLTGVETSVAWFPSQQDTSFGVDGQHLFEVNCSMCHGNQGKGDGPVLQKLMSPDYEYTPLLTPDLTSEQVIAMGREGIEGFMRSGVNVMPNFSKLLNGEEMAAISEYITGTLQ